MKKEVIILIILLSYNVFSYGGDRPVDCDPENPDVYYGNLEICSNDIDDNCNVDDGIDFDIDPSTGKDENDIVCCNIFNVEWSKENAVEGETVQLIVTAKEACDGLEVNFVIKEKDLITGDDDVNLNPIPVEVKEVDGEYKAIGNWIVEYQEDGLFGDPEYYFTAYIDDYLYGSVEMESGLLDVTQGLMECGDGNLDDGEDCFNCPDDAGCGVNENCVFDEEWICGLEGDSSCDDDEICENGENCECGDCLDKQDGCIKGLICNESLVCDNNPSPDGYCNPDYPENDPDCCDFTNPSWQYGCIGEGQTNRMSVYGKDCDQEGMEFRIYKDKFLGDEFIETVSPIVEDGLIYGDWIVINGDEYYFKIGEGSQETKSDNMETRECDVVNDEDCDGVCNPGTLSEEGKCSSEIGDMCYGTEACAEVDENGCSGGQGSCLSQWDCTNAVWGECDEDTGLMIRDIGNCVFVGSDPNCQSFTPPSTKQCLRIERFSVFTLFNVLIVSILLMLYYLRRGFSFK